MVQVVCADLSDEAHGAALLELLDTYARDPMGESAPLADDVRAALVPRLRQHPTTRVFIAYADDRPVGLAICFVGFSTFAARPLLNIHDVVVAPHVRGQGVGKTLLAYIEDAAQQMGCCKLTLEVRRDNHVARRVYRQLGFGDDDGSDAAMSFWTKKL